MNFQSQAGIILLFLAVLSSCSPPDAGHPSNLISPFDSTRVSDTFLLEDELVMMEFITEEAFAAAKDQGSRCGETGDEQIHLVMDSLMVKKYDSVYIVRQDNGSPAHLIGYPSLFEDSEKYAEYKYLGRLGQSDLLVFSGSYYEYYDFIVLDLKTGEQTHTWGSPTLSPGNKFLVAINADLEAGFTTNGIQIFEYDSKGLHLRAAKQSDRWGPERLKWVDARTVMMRQYKRTEAGTLTDQYVKFTLPL